MNCLRLTDKSPSSPDGSDPSDTGAGLSLISSIESPLVFSPVFLVLGYVLILAVLNDNRIRQNPL